MKKRFIFDDIPAWREYMKPINAKHRAAKIEKLKRIAKTTLDVILAVAAIVAAVFSVLTYIRK